MADQTFGMLAASKGEQHGTMNKHILLLAVSALLGAGTAQAQSKAPANERDPVKMEKRAQERADQRTEELVRELGLNAEQAQKVGQINSAFAQGMTDVRAAALEDAARKEKAKGLRQQREAELKAVLTEAQYAKLQELRKAKRAEKQQQKGQHHGKGGHRGPAMEKPTAQ